MVLEPAVLDRVDSHLEPWCRGREAVEHGPEPQPFGSRPRWKLQTIEGGERGSCGTGSREQLTEQLSCFSGRCRDCSRVLMVERGTQCPGLLVGNRKGLGHSGHQCRQGNVY